MIRRKEYKRLLKRLDSLEQTVSFLDEWSSAVSSDIERLHEQVNMWAANPLKDRVTKLENECVTHYPPKYASLMPDDYIQIQSDGELYTVRTSDKQKMVLDQEQLDSLIDLLIDGGYYGL